MIAKTRKRVKGKQRFSRNFFQKFKYLKQSGKQRNTVDAGVKYFCRPLPVRSAGGYFIFLAFCGFFKMRAGATIDAANVVSEKIAELIGV